MVKAIGYVRRSTDRQEESLDQQRAKLEAFASARGWELVEVFADDAISGSDMDRPGLAKLLADTEKRPDVGAVLAWDRNRLARPKDPVAGLMLERRILQAGKRVFYVGSGQEAVRSFTSDLVGLVEHHQNGDYLRKLSRDTMRGSLSRAQRGLWAGGAIPYGYDRLILDAALKPRRIVRDMPDRSQLVLDATPGNVIEQMAGSHRYMKQDHEVCSLVPSEPERVKAVASIFADYAAGVPIRQIRERLNKAGLRNGRGHKFIGSTIHHILENSAYTGVYIYNRQTESKWHRVVNGQSVERLDEGTELRPESDWVVVPDAWPTLVDQETFDRVQARRRVSKDAWVKVTGDKVHSEYLLTGLFSCGVCGGRMVGASKMMLQGRKIRSYVCINHHRGHHDACPKRFAVPAELVERHIVGLIEADLANLRDDSRLADYVAAEVERLTGRQVDAGKLLQRRLAELDQQAATLREHLKKMDYATAEALGLYAEAKNLTSERAAVERDLKAAGAGLPDVPDLGDIRERAAVAFDRLAGILANGPIEQRRELIGLYVQSVKADPIQQKVVIALYPALFNAIGTGEGRERGIPTYADRPRNPGKSPRAPVGFYQARENPVAGPAGKAIGRPEVLPTAPDRQVHRGFHVFAGHAHYRARWCKSRRTPRTRFPTASEIGVVGI
jgi:DNA invertase Pin-like site-specific DNA recombinase